MADEKSPLPTHERETNANIQLSQISKCSETVAFKLKYRERWEGDAKWDTDESDAAYFRTLCLGMLSLLGCTEYFLNSAEPNDK